MCFTFPQTPKKSPACQKKLRFLIRYFIEIFRGHASHRENNRMKFKHCKRLLEIHHNLMLKVKNVSLFPQLRRSCGFFVFVWRYGYDTNLVENKYADLLIFTQTSLQHFHELLVCDQRSLARLFSDREQSFCILFLVRVVT